MNLLLLKRKYYIAAFIITISLNVPSSAFSQDQEDLQQEQDYNTAPAGVGGSGSGPVIGSTSPWGNSASTPAASNEVGENSIGTGIETNPQQQGTGTLRNRLSRPGGLRTGIGPGGNPDVPFDDTMNLFFLAAGVLFAGWAIKRKMQKSSAINR